MYNKKAVIILKYNKNRQKASLPGLPIFLREGVAAHLGDQACRCPLRDVAYHVRLKQFNDFNTHLNIVPLWKTFVTRKKSAIFESGLYSTSSNSTIMNRNKQVNHSKQETISVIFTHPSPNQSINQSMNFI